jgi:integrase
MAAWVSEWKRTILPPSPRKESTKALYAALADSHIAPPPFGSARLSDVRPRHVDAFLSSLRDKGLSESTVRTVYVVLRTVLDGAVRDHLLAENPAHRVKRPTVNRKEARHIDPDEVRRLLDAASSSRFHGALALIAATGLRRGEALGLEWDDIDDPKQVIRVRRTLGRVGGGLTATPPKTRNSRRDIPITPAVAAIIRTQRAAQAAERLKAGSQWAGSKYVFTTELGAPIDPRNLLRALTNAARTAGIEDVGLHTLRHSAATMMLNAGVPLHVVSRILGHSSVSITGDIYGHVNDSSQREAMASLSTVLGL